MSDAVVSIDEAFNLAFQALLNLGVSDAMARSTAKALVAAEIDGQAGHGLARVAPYALHVRCGKVNPTAVATATVLSPAAIAIDAHGGLAYLAIDLAIERLPAMAQQNIIAVAAIRHSHHFGQAGAHVERLANQGLVALMFGNTPSAMSLWGGTQPLLGTNPLAFACPQPDADPLVIDLALSVAARGKIQAARKNHAPIPEGWALDAQGNPTTDPERALQGSLLPIGGPKGAALALMIEILAAALTNSQFAFEASSFFDDAGGPPHVGQLLIVIDGERLSQGGFTARLRALFEAVASDAGVRLPGSKRLRCRARARAQGLTLSQSLLNDLRQLAGSPARVSDSNAVGARGADGLVNGPVD